MPVPDRQTDRRTNIMARLRRFVLTNASGAKYVLWHSELKSPNVYIYIFYMVIDIRWNRYNQIQKTAIPDQVHSTTNRHSTRCLKNCANLFLSELHEISTNLDNVWQIDSKEAKIMQSALIFTSSNSRNHTTVLNADVPHCYTTL